MNIGERKGKRNYFQYNVNLSKNIFPHYRGIPEKIEYDGLVYCATVPNDTLLVRRKGKVAFIHNCHEGWAKQKMGWMIYRELFEGIDVPLLVNGGVLDIEFGGQVYRAGLFHKSRYWSTLNKGHGGERIMDRIADCELVYTSHMHKAGVTRSTRYNPPFRKATAVVAGGTSKLKDSFMRGWLGEEGEPGFQSAMLWADKHNMEVVFDLESARELMLDAIKDEEAKKIERLREEIAKFK